MALPFTERNACSVHSLSKNSFFLICFSLMFKTSAACFHQSFKAKKKNAQIIHLLYCRNTCYCVFVLSNLYASEIKLFPYCHKCWQTSPQCSHDDAPAAPSSGKSRGLFCPVLFFFLFFFLCVCFWFCFFSPLNVGLERLLKKITLLCVWVRYWFH